MRRTLLLALLCLSPVAAAAEAPPPPPGAPAAGPRWTLQIDPLTTALGYVHLQIERALAPHWSVYVGPHSRLFSSPLSDTDEAFVGYGAEAGLRYFFRPSAPQGPWAQVRGVAAHLTAEGTGETAVGGYVSALGGWTWIFAGHLVLAAGGGVQYIHYRVDGLGPQGVFPALHTTVGAAF